MNILSFIKKWWSLPPQGTLQKARHTGYEMRHATMSTPHKERITKIRTIMLKSGWMEIDWQENIFMLSYSKEGVRMNIYYSRMTVGTAMHHPKRGDTQLFRRNVSMESLEKLALKPRLHTGVGYYKKGK